MIPRDGEERAAGNVVPLHGGLVRELPQNLEAEQALLGTIMIHNSAYQQVAEFLRAEHFAVPVHGRLFDAIAMLIEQGRIANPITLHGWFQADGSLEAVGGARYLAQLAASAVTLLNADAYGRTILDCHLRRELVAVGDEVISAAIRPLAGDHAGAQIERAEAKLFSLASGGEAGGGFRSFGAAGDEAIEAADLAYKQGGQPIGVPTGFSDLDGLLGGLHRSDLVILAARPSMGKTALGTQIALNAATRGRRVGFFSLEMSRQQLAQRVLAGYSGVSAHRIRLGTTGLADFGRFSAAKTRLAGLALEIDDTAALSIGAARTRARRLKRQRGLDLIVVDYLQLLRPTSRAENRVQEIAQITQAMKALAKDLDLPVLALSQLSRAVEQREDKRPLLSDLRESGTIEQDADVVMFLYREEYYLARRSERDDSRLNQVRNLAEVIVAKQRHGPIGTVRLHFDADTTGFADLDRRHGHGGADQAHRSVAGGAP